MIGLNTSYRPQDGQTASALDKALNCLVDALQLSFQSRCPVIVELLDAPQPEAVLLPFYLLLLRPDSVPELPLNATFGVLPISRTDRAIVEGLWLSVSDVFERRRASRWQRYQESRHLAQDLEWCDWESRFGLHKGRLSGTTLPAHSFLSLDLVSTDSSVKQGHRPVLGRVAERNGIRLAVLAPSPGSLDESAITPFTQVDVLLINMQGVRGVRAINFAKEVLRRRAASLPTIVVLDGPTQYLDLRMQELIDHRLQLVTLHGRWDPQVSCTLVGQDRPQAEKVFRDAIGGLEDLSHTAARFVQQATRTWWSLRQTLNPFPSDILEYKRWMALYDEVTQKDSPEIAFFTAANNLLRAAAGDLGCSEERRSATVNALVTAKHSPIQVMGRTRFEARLALEETKSLLGLESDDLITLGLEAEGPDIQFDNSPGAVVCSGFFGPRQLTRLRSLAPRFVHFTVDPVEASWAYYETRRIATHLKEHGAIQESYAYEALAKEFRSLMTLVPSDDDQRIGVDLGLNGPGRDIVSPSHGVTRPAGRDELIVQFTDGSDLYVGPNARLEVVSGTRSGVIRTCRAIELSPGDEVLIVDSDFQASFSQRLIEALDNSLLRQEADHRAQWVSLVYSMKPPSVKLLHDRLTRLGIRVSYATVRTWVPLSPQDNVAAPLRWEEFSAFASALDITLPPEYLGQLYGSIRRLRVMHRKAGRALVRVIRGAYLGRLHPNVLRQVQEQWGFGLRELVLSARLMTVDRVIMSEG